MEYAQLNEALTEAIQVTTHGNVVWDSTHTCPASALTEDEAIQFRVVPLTITQMPSFNPITQQCIRDGCEKVGDVWQYKWAVSSLPAEIIAANQAAKTIAFQKQVVDAIQSRLDTFAQTRNYQDILSAVSYVNSSVPNFAADAAYCVTARDNTWATLHTLYAEVQANTRTIPETVQGVLDLLPTLAWPATP